MITAEANLQLLHIKNRFGRLANLLCVGLTTVASIDTKYISQDTTTYRTYAIRQASLISLSPPTLRHQRTSSKSDASYAVRLDRVMGGLVNTTEIIKRQLLTSPLVFYCVLFCGTESKLFLRAAARTLSLGEQRSMRADPASVRKGDHCAFPV